MHCVWNALKENIESFGYRRTGYGNMQEKSRLCIQDWQTYLAVRKAYGVKGYLPGKVIPVMMAQICLEKGLDVTIYHDVYTKEDYLNEIREDIEKGIVSAPIDVTEFLYDVCTWKEMKKEFDHNSLRAIWCNLRTKHARWLTRYFDHLVVGHEGYKGFKYDKDRYAMAIVIRPS